MTNKTVGVLDLVKLSKLKGSKVYTLLGTQEALARTLARLEQPGLLNEAQRHQHLKDVETYLMHLKPYWVS